MPRGPFTWDDANRRYRDAGGRFLSREEVRRAVNSALDNGQERARKLGLDFAARRISAAEFRSAMRDEIKNTHLWNAAAANGGWDQMDAAAFGRQGPVIRRQYEYLEGFIDDVRTGKQPRDGTMGTRAQMYAEAGRATFQYEDKLLMIRAGFDEEKSVLGISDHCDGCVEEADKGWAPIGTLKPIGARTCLVKCNCHFEYRRSEAVES